MHSFLLILVAIVWGSTFVVIKDTVATINPFFIVFARCLLAALPIFIHQIIPNHKILFDRVVIIKGGILGILFGRNLFLPDHRTPIYQHRTQRLHYRILRSSRPHYSPAFF